MIAALVIVGIVAGTALMATDSGRIAALDTARSQLKSFGVNLPPEAEAKMERDIMETPLWRLGINAAVAQIVGGLVLPLIIAGVLFLVFNVMMGGDATFKQMFATIAHGNPVMVIGSLFTTPLMYFRGSMSGVTNLGVDLIRVWWVFVLAVGLGVLYKRKTGPIAIGLFVVYGIIAVIFAAVTAGRAGA